jgi:predicted XRE-type DNA-binding protein
MSDASTDFEIGSGNVFADLGLPDPEERLMKAQISRQIALAIQGRRLTQAEAAEIMGINQPKVSAILRGRLSGFSVERLIVLLLRLGKDVQLVVKPKPRSRATGTFSVTAGRSAASSKSTPKRKAAVKSD